MVCPPNAQSVYRIWDRARYWTRNHSHSDDHATHHIIHCMTSHFADPVTAAIKEKRTPLCVGLDPRWEQLPDEIRSRHGSGTLASMARAFEEFCLRVLDVVAPLVAVVKPQSAFFEACGPAGLVAL